MPNFIHYSVTYMRGPLEEVYLIYAENEREAKEIFVEAYIKNFSTENPGDEEEKARESIKSIEELVID